MLEVFEMDPDSARTMTVTEVETAMREVPPPPDGPYWVRVAEHGGWGVALEIMELKGFLDNIVQRASLGTEAVTISVNAKGPGELSYYVDGTWTTQFGISEPYDTRAGTEPNRFRDALAEVGLGGLEDGTIAGPPPIKDQLGGVLTMLTTSLGISLPREVYFGPLLTGKRTQPYAYHQRTCG
jgi:uncharacterized protein DUF6461